MSLGSFVLFEHHIISSPFEKNFHQVSGVTVVINNQDAPLFFRSPSANRTWPGETAVGFPGQIIRLDYLFHTFRSPHFFLAFPITLIRRSNDPRSPTTPCRKP